MQSEPREPQAPESYHTFWEPIVVDAPAAPPLTPAPSNTDAYQEFVNVTEGVPLARHAERRVQRIEDHRTASAFVLAEAASQTEDQSLSLPLEIARSVLRLRQSCRMQQVVTVDDE